MPIPGLSFSSQKQKTNVNSVNTSSLAFNPTVSASVGGSVGQSPSGSNRSDPRADLVSNDQDSFPNPLAFAPSAGLPNILGGAAAGLIGGPSQPKLAPNQFPSINGGGAGLSQAGIPLPMIIGALAIGGFFLWKGQP